VAGDRVAWVAWSWLWYARRHISRHRRGYHVRAPSFRVILKHARLRKA